MFCIIHLFGILSFALATTIETFNDQNCQDSLRSLTSENGYVSNGYPNGTCTRLNEAGQFSSFQIVEIDPGCTATIYGKDTDPNEPCSANILELAQLPPTCYNASWVYFSIDECNPPSSKSVSSSSTVTTSSSSSSRPTPSPSSSETASSSSSETASSSLSKTANSSLSSTVSFLSTITSRLTEVSTSSSPTAINPSLSLAGGASASPVQQTDSRHETEVIIGGVVGSVAGVLILVALFSLGYRIGHRRKRQDPTAKDEAGDIWSATAVPAPKSQEFDTQGAKVELDELHGRIEAEGVSNVISELSGAPDTEVSELADTQNK